MRYDNIIFLISNLPVFSESIRLQEGNTENMEKYHKYSPWYSPKSAYQKCHGRIRNVKIKNNIAHSKNDKTHDSIYDKKLRGLQNEIYSDHSKYRQ
jgi:hypothetical protein